MPNPAKYQIEIADGIVVIKNQNTTIGYSRFTDAGDVEYIYVNPMYRRQGYGALLLDQVRRIAGQIGTIHTPVSPLGTAFFVGLWGLPCPIQLRRSQTPQRGNFCLSGLMKWIACIAYLGVGRLSIPFLNHS